MSDISFVYDTDPGDDITFDIPAPTGGGGVTVHSALTGRAEAEQHPTSAITGLDTALAAKEDAGVAATLIAAAIAGLLDGAPGALDTLNELAAALGDDASFAASVTTALAGKVPTTRTLAGLDLSADRTAAALRTALNVDEVTGTRTPTDGSVTTAKIVDGTITVDDLAAAVVARFLPSGGADGQTVVRAGGVATWGTGVTAPTVSDPQWGALFFTGQYTASHPRSAASALTSNRLYYVPLLVSHTQAFDRIACLHEGSTGGAGSVARLGVYSRAADGNVGALHIDCGTVDLSTAGAFKAVTTSFTLTAGLWWLGLVAQITSGSPTLSVGAPLMSVPSTDQTSGGSKFQNSVTGALPNPATPGANNVATPPCIWVRAA